MIESRLHIYMLINTYTYALELSMHFLGNQMFQDIKTYLAHFLAGTCLVNDMKDI